MKPRRSAAMVVAVSLVVFAALSSISAQVADAVPFLARYTANADGAIVTTGNNLLTCPEPAATCAADRAGEIDDDSVTMTHLDADGVAGTFSSSSSTLVLPEGSTLLWAVLHRGVRLQRGTSAARPAAAPARRCSCGPRGRRAARRSPRSRSPGPDAAGHNAYQGFADITTSVRAADVTLVRADPMLAGRPATWRLTVTGTGPSVADTVVVSYVVPDGMTCVSATTEDGTSCPAPRLRDTELIVGRRLDALEPGASLAALEVLALVGGLWWLVTEQHGRHAR